MTAITSESRRQPSSRRIAAEGSRYQPAAPEQMPFADAAWPVWRPVRLAGR